MHDGDEGRPRKMSGKMFWKKLLWMTLATIVVVVAGGAALIHRLAQQIGPPPLAKADNLSVIVVDRNDRLLRAFTTKDGRWRLPVTVNEVDPRYLKILLAYEDRRFYEHGGIDPVAVLRAGLLLIRHGRLLSGASTLTMQAARLLDGVHERTLLGKLRQMIRAYQLEARLSKNQILNLYLRLAPMGGNIEGVRAASLAYFGKEPRRLSIGQAALLVAIPQSPSARRPDRHWRRARRARNRVIRRVMKAGVISKAEADRAINEPMPKARRNFSKLAPHLAEQEVRRAPRQGIHRLTIDRDVQARLEKLVRSHARALGSRLSAALIVVDHRTGQIIAYVGAADYFDKTRFGSIDMVMATRSPGSTLKPFIYGLAFEAGLAHPETLIEDRAIRFGSYAPKNFDHKLHGTISIRTALSQSLNIPAVKLLHAVGPAKLLGRFRNLGSLLPLPATTQPTLALALGGIGLRMHDLAALYASLAEGGRPVPIHYRRGEAKNETAARRSARHAASLAANNDRSVGLPARGSRPGRLMSPLAAWYVADILKDAPPPVAARRGLIAYKTGTSYGFRDAWAAGFDGHHVIIAWVGRPDGASTPNLTGRVAAAPLLFDAFARLSPHRAPLAGPPRGVLRVRTGADLPPPLRRFDRGFERTSKGPFIETGLRIAFPPDRVAIEIETEPDGASGKERPLPVMLKAEGGALPLTWLADGKPLRSSAYRRDVAFTPGGRGFVKLSVIDAKGHVDRVTVRFQ